MSNDGAPRVLQPGQVVRFKEDGSEVIHTTPLPENELKPDERQSSN
jgi:hypothetical protein